MMLRRLVLSLAACTAAALLIPAVPATATVDPGPTFNDPLGNSAEQFGVIDKIEQAIVETPRGATIRVAAYVLTVPETADKLVAARRRGVNVRVVLDSHSQAAPVKKLRAVLGSNPAEGSYVVHCKQTCRGGGGNMHMKLYTFSRTGDARRVVMMGSSNLANANATRHWNDIYTIIGDRGLYDASIRVHGQLSADRSLDNPHSALESGRYAYYTFPSGGSSPATDTIYQELGKVRCTGALDGAGVDGHTVIKVSMFAWTGRRGLYLLERLTKLGSAGCDVEVTIGKGAREIKAGLRASNIEFYDSKIDTDGNEVPDKYVHTKYVLISGNHDGDPSAWRVFTGSQNWSGGGLRRADEDILGINGREAYLAYVEHFSRVRKSANAGAPSAAMSVTVAPKTRETPAHDKGDRLVGLQSSRAANRVDSAGTSISIALGPLAGRFGLSDLVLQIPASRL